MLGVRCQDAVVSHQIAAWPRDQRRESGQELDRLEHKMGGAVPVRGLLTIPPTFADASDLRIDTMRPAVAAAPWHS